MQIHIYLKYDCNAEISKRRSVCHRRVGQTEEKNSGLFPVKIEVVYRRIQKYIPTGVDMSEQEWTKSATSSRGNKKLPEIERVFNHVRETVDSIVSNGAFSHRKLQLRLDSSGECTVNVTIRRMMKKFLDEGKVNSYYRCRSTLLNIEGFGGTDIRFADITGQWLRDCESRWVKEGKSLSRKLALTKQQIKQIMEFSGTPRLEMYRDLWLFSYLCNGINFRDMLFLKYGSIVNGEICFARSKTMYAYGRSKVIRAAIAIRQVISKCNNALRRIASQIGIPPFTTYSARHSFATVMQRSGIAISFISESLGHSSLSVTENYLAGFDRETRFRNASVLTELS